MHAAGYQSWSTVFILIRTHTADDVQLDSPTLALLSISSSLQGPPPLAAASIHPLQPQKPRYLLIERQEQCKWSQSDAVDADVLAQAKE